MPNLPARQCGRCGAVVPCGGQCQNCKPNSRDNYRLTAAKRGYDNAWQKVRYQKLRVDPLCECDSCQAGKKRVTVANMVHHIEPIETHPELRLVWSNLQSMNRDCHERLHGRKK